MSKRVRYTSNNTSLIVGKIHRRVFKNFVSVATSVPSGPNAVTNISATTDFSFGSDTLPRRPGYVWAQEVIKVVFMFQQNDLVYPSKVEKMYAAVATSNNPSFLADLTTTIGPIYAFRRDEVIAVYGTEFLYQGPTDTAAALTYPAGYVLENSEKVVDLTDLMGQGVLVFGNNLYLITQLWNSSGVAGQTWFAAAEVWFKYVEVPLEYYLSTQQDQAASGV